MPFEDRYIWGIIALGGIADAPRIFDPTRRAVRFWGHDSAMEWSFFVTEGALKRLQPNVERSEARSKQRWGWGACEYDAASDSFSPSSQRAAAPPYATVRT